MYTYNILVYGHDISNNPELNNQLVDYDLEFYSDGYEVDFPYHGGQVRGDVYSVVFGEYITDNDGNPNYITKVREVKEEDHKEGYLKFVEKYKNYLLEDKGVEDDYDEFVDKLVEYLDKTEPCFYSVEASS